MKMPSGRPRRFNPKLTKDMDKFMVYVSDDLAAWMRAHVQGNKQRGIRPDSIQGLIEDMLIERRASNFVTGRG